MLPSGGVYSCPCEADYLIMVVYLSMSMAVCFRYPSTRMEGGGRGLSSAIKQFEWCVGNCRGPDNMTVFNTTAYCSCRIPGW